MYHYWHWLVDKLATLAHGFMIAIQISPPIRIPHVATSACLSAFFMEQIVYFALQKK